MQTLPPLDGRYDLDASLIEAFRRDGHVVVPGLAGSDEVAAFRGPIETAVEQHNAETRPIEDRDTYSKAFLQTFNLWRVDETVAAFVTARRFAEVAAALLEVDAVRIYHDQALFKEAHGGPTPWHQDQFYWPLGDTPTVTMWMPLEDLDPAVGSMNFASGTHREGVICDLPISDDSEVEIDRIIGERGLEVVNHGALRTGDATFHGGWTLHGAGGNPTDQMRKVMTVIYFADGAVIEPSATDYHEFDRIMWLGGLEPGSLAASPLNPIVYP